MDFINFMQVIVFLIGVSSSLGWQFFTTLNDFALTNSAPDPVAFHSEYSFGHCKDKNKAFYVHKHLDHMDVLGKLIIREWLDLKRIPTCIIIRATAYEEDTFRSTAYNFQICVPRITYCHSKRRYKYFYYEWYIPDDMIGGMNWDLYFFGPAKEAW